MAREFICLYFSWLETGATLTDEEFGRMCRAGLQYGLDGTEPDLPGNDKILFPVMKWQVDGMFPNSMKFAKSAVKQAAEAEKAKANKVKQIKQMLLLLSKMKQIKQMQAIQRRRLRLILRLLLYLLLLLLLNPTFPPASKPTSRTSALSHGRRLMTSPASWPTCPPTSFARLSVKQRSTTSAVGIMSRPFSSAAGSRTSCPWMPTAPRKKTTPPQRPTRAAPAARPQSKQAAVRERLKKRLEEMGGVQSDDPADNRIYVEATELVAEPLPGE